MLDFEDFRLSNRVQRYNFVMEKQKKSKLFVCFSRKFCNFVANLFIFTIKHKFLT